MLFELHEKRIINNEIYVERFDFADGIRGRLIVLLLSVSIDIYGT